MDVIKKVCNYIEAIKKVIAHMCHCSKFLCLTRHSILVLFVFRRLVALIGGTGQ